MHQQSTFTRRTNRITHLVSHNISRNNSFKQKQSPSPNSHTHPSQLKLTDYLKFIIKHQPAQSLNPIIEDLNGTWFKETNKIIANTTRLYSTLPIKKITENSLLKKHHKNIQKQLRQYERTYTPPNTFPLRFTSPIKLIYQPKNKRRIEQTPINTTDTITSFLSQISKSKQQTSRPFRTKVTKMMACQSKDGIRGTKIHLQPQH